MAHKFNQEKGYIKKRHVILEIKSYTSLFKKRKNEF